VSGQLIPISDVSLELVQQASKAALRAFLETYSAAQVELAISNALGGSFQPLDVDLTAISQLSTTNFGRQLLTQIDAAAVRSYIGAGTSNSTFGGTFNELFGKPTTLFGYGIIDAQPLDSDLTAIATAGTAPYGISLLALANQAALQAAHGVTSESQADQVFSEPITWTGTSAPSGTATLRYEWERVGKIVSFRFRFEWTVAGAAITRAVFALPATMPVPRALTGEGNSEISCGASGVMTATTALGNAVNSTAVDTRIQRDASGNPEVWIRATSTATNGIAVNGSYLCQ
jgi:hypothetical protein